MKKSNVDQYSSSSAYLPEEIILKILTPLPAKSIGRCRCVSQRWRTLLSNPEFIEAHLNLSARRRHKAVRLEKKEKRIYVLEVNLRDAVASSMELKRFEMPKNLLCDWIVFGSSYNGLILAQGLTYRLFLLNPTIQEWKQLPRHPAANYPNRVPGFLMLGMGYNKVVAISHTYEVYVCSLGSDTTSWKRVQIENSPLDDSVFYKSEHRNGVFLNGSIHWLVSIRSNWPDSRLIRLKPIIIAFDVTEEMFRVVPTPPLPRARKNWLVDDLRVVGESLCVTCMKKRFADGEWDRDRKIEVWVMNEYGVESSWTKIQLPQCHPHHIDFCCQYPLYFGNEEFMFRSSCYSAEAVIHNVKDKSSSRKIDMTQLPFTLRVGDIAYGRFALFADTLVSPCQLITYDQTPLDDDDEDHHQIDHYWLN